jgi:hypothetical protein
MNNRKKIEKFCKENGIEIISIEYLHATEMAYGSSCDAPYWLIYGWFQNKEICFESSYTDDTVQQAVEEMLVETKEDLNNPENGSSLFTGITR